MGREGDRQAERAHAGRLQSSPPFYLPLVASAGAVCLEYLRSVQVSMPGSILSVRALHHTCAAFTSSTVEAL